MRVALASSVPPMVWVIYFLKINLQTRHSRRENPLVSVLPSLVNRSKQRVFVRPGNRARKNGVCGWVCGSILVVCPSIFGIFQSNTRLNGPTLKVETFLATLLLLQLCFYYISFR